MIVGPTNTKSAAHDDRGLQAGNPYSSEHHQSSQLVARHCYDCCCCCCCCGMRRTRCAFTAGRWMTACQQSQCQRHSLLTGQNSAMSIIVSILSYLTRRQSLSMRERQCALPPAVLDRWMIPCHAV